MRERRMIHYILLLCFLAGIYRGHVAIWQRDDPEPMITLPYLADLLPKADRLALSRGIPLNTQEDLTRFLEDFCS